MNELEKKFILSLGPEFDHSAKPIVYFYDYACKQNGKFVNAVYISKRSKTAHETQDFRRKANDEDKAEFPREWEYYLKVRENLALPKIDLLPGIDQATLMTIKELGIFNLEQLAEMNEFEPWNLMSRRILNAINKEGSEGRDGVSGNEQAPVRVLAANWPSEGSSNAYQKETRYSQGQEVTFSFEVIQ